MMKHCLIYSFLVMTPITGSWVDHNPFGFYEVPQGWCSVETKYGKISRVAETGLRWKNPLTTKNDLVETRWQTDYLKNVECGSSQGGTVYLDIAVNNKLSNENECVSKMIKEHGVDYDKKLIKEFIPSEVAQFCKNYKVEDIYTTKFDELDEILATSLSGNIKAYGMEECLEIKKTGGVRISRPKLTNEMKEKFEKIEAEEKERHLQERIKETDKVKSENEHQTAAMKAEQEKEVSRINAEKQRLEELNQAEIQTIKDKTLANKIISEAEARKKSKMLEAEADEKWLTTLRIQYETALANAKNAKLVFGAPEKSLIHLGNQMPPMSKEELVSVFNNDHP